MVCAGIHRKLALACALDKEIFHLNATILYSLLLFRQLYFLLLGTCFVLVYIGNKHQPVLQNKEYFLKI